MMHRVLVSAGLSLALCVPLAACDGGGGSSAPVANKEEIAKAIDQDSRKLLEDFRSRDVSRIAAHYAEDALFAAPNRPAMKGRDAIARELGASVNDPAFAIDFANEKTEVAASGDLAYSRGTYTVSFTDPQSKGAVTERGTYVTIYRKQSDGSWKIVEDIVAPAAPAAAQSAVAAG